MDGQYQNNNEKYIEILSKWISHIIDTKGWERADDLHIDEIDILFSKRELWFDGGLYLYNIVYDIIDKSMYDCLLSIPLRYGRKKTNMQNINMTIAYIKNRIHDMTPPSIYLFKKNDANYNLTLLKSHYLEKLSNQLEMNAYFLEQEDYPKEFDRWVFITHKYDTNLKRH